MLVEGHIWRGDCARFLRARAIRAEREAMRLNTSPSLLLELFWQLVVNSQLDLRERRQLLGRLGQIHGHLKLQPVRFAKPGNEL